MIGAFTVQGVGKLSDIANVIYMEDTMTGQRTSKKAVRACGLPAYEITNDAREGDDTTHSMTFVTVRTGTAYIAVYARSAGVANDPLAQAWLGSFCPSAAGWIQSRTSYNRLPWARGGAAEAVRSLWSVSTDIHRLPTSRTTCVISSPARLLWFQALTSNR